MNLCIFDHHLIEKNNLHCLRKLGSRELYQIQRSEKQKKTTSQLYYKGYFNNFDFNWKSIYLLPRMVTVDTKLGVFQYKILSNIIFVNNKVESPLSSFCKAEVLRRKLQNVFITTLDLPSISPQSAIFGFLHDALKHELLLNHISLIFKNYLYKARENKDLKFNILKDYLTKIRDLEANLKDNDKYNKKWTLISNILYNVSKKKIKAKSSKKVL